MRERVRISDTDYSDHPGTYSMPLSAATYGPVCTPHSTDPGSDTNGKYLEMAMD
jgi:hypothetical protein